MIIRHNRLLQDAYILSRSGDVMRIAMERAEDALELRLVNGVWFTEDWAPVSFEFLWASEIPLVLPEDGAPGSPPPDPLRRGDRVSNAFAC